MGRPASPIREWVPFDLTVARHALDTYSTARDRADWLTGFCAGAAGGPIWSRATPAEQAGYDEGRLARADADASKARTSEMQRERARKRWSNRVPPPE